MYWWMRLLVMAALRYVLVDEVAGHGGIGHNIVLASGFSN